MTPPALSDRLAGDGRPVYDVVGVGFGPANLALAAVIEEEAGVAGRRPVASLFLERRPAYAWHPGMLLGGALVQLSFLKDLATLRDPRSPFTFLNYLKAKGRLDKFVNLRNFFPTRLEFNDYFAWVAEQVGEQVRYGREVLAVAPVAASGGAVERLRVTARDPASGKVEEHTTRNLVLATGGVPLIPPGVELPAGCEESVFHSHHFLERVTRGFPDAAAPYRFLVVGSGQSAAEIFQYLIRHYPNAQVTATFRRFAYKPADNSDFVNEIFFPQMIGFLYGLPETKRRTLLRQHEDTNYSAVDVELIQSIYRTLYERMVAGDQRAAVRPFMELSRVKEGAGGVVAEFFNMALERPEYVEADAVVLATGYRREKRHPLLAQLEPWLVPEGRSGYRVTRDYRVATRPGFAPDVYLQGFCEDTHGLSDTLLSVLPIRSQEILRSLLRERAAADAGLDEEAVALMPNGEDRGS
jgi:L-ornithine N5-oxygenase